MSTYRFDKRKIADHFRSACGVALFADGEREGDPVAAVNARCLQESSRPI